MSLLENNYMIYIILFFIVILLFNLYCKEDKIEKMTDLSSADTQAIRTLADFSSRLQAGGITIPGNLNVTGSFNYLPRGTIVAWYGHNIPKGWALCDGNNDTPNLRGRFILGSGGTQGKWTFGGEETVRLTEAQMPSHSHTMLSAGEHSHSVQNIVQQINNTGGNQPHNNMPPYFVLDFIMKL